MKNTILISLFLLSAISIFGQSMVDTIQIKKGFGTIFRMNGKSLRPNQLLDITKSNPEAYKEMKIAKKKYDVGSVFGTIGGAFVGWPLGTAIAGGKPNWTLAGIGAGLIVVATPFSSSYIKHTKNAVNIYNHGIKQSSSKDVGVHFSLIGNGFYLKMTF